MRLRKTHGLLFASLLAAAILPLGCAGKQDGADAAGKVAAPGADGALAPESAPAASKEAGKAATTAPALPRKIIYTATVELAAEKLDTAGRTLTTQVKQAGGYISETNTGGSTAPNAVRTATYKVRIPTDKFEAFLAGLGSLGEMQNSQTTSEDVSEEFYDVDARLKNKRVEEARLIQYLKTSSPRLQDILAIEKEISRVREEIERMEGRLRFLSNQTAFSTVTITLHEIAGYVPPTAPGLGTQIGRTFGASLTALGEAAKAIVLVFVALLPWLLVMAGIVLPLVALHRRRTAAAQRKTQAETRKDTSNL